jgi:hypothetical protein
VSRVSFLDCPGEAKRGQAFDSLARKKYTRHAMTEISLPAEIEIPASDECYTFTINDTYGDGICCAYGTGSYSITDDSGNTIISGGEFSSIDTSTFRVGESLGINSFTDNNLKIFPNPSNGIFTIKTSLENSTYQIYNLIGQYVKSGSIINGSNLIDLRNSIDGVYFMTIQAENGEKTGYTLIQN